MSDFIHKLFTSYKERTDGDTRIGELNRIWYDSITNTLRIQLDDTPGGTIIGGGSGGGDYTLPTASTTVKGGVKIDGTTITINNQVISGFSGSYTDLTNKPTIPAAQVNSDWSASSGLAQILNKPTLFSGSYTDLTNKPTIYSSAYIGTTSLDFTRESASQTLTGVSIDGSVVWTNSSPAPGTPWRTTINAASGNANIVLYSGLPGFGSSVSWTFDETKITFPDATTQSTAAVAQIQSDWTQSNNTSLDYIKNKPTIPSAYTLPTATDTILGGVKIGSNISINAGVISVAAPFSGSYTDLTNKPTIPAAQIQSDWTQTNNASLDYIKNKPTIPDITNIEDTLAATGEPMGHEDKDQSTISFDSTSRTFTITPVAANFEVWVRGTKHTYTTAQSVTIPNTSGIYYIYFDSNGLGAQTDYFIWDEQAPTALVYYNAVTGLAPYFADERHGTTLDWQTHEYLHRTRGAVIANGFSVGSYTIGGEVQLDIANGTFFDEDLQIDVTHSNTPTANTWQQDLQGPAQIPMFYLSGTGWVRDNPTGYLNKQGTSRPRYNSLSGGVWSVADIDNNKYGTTFIVATNNLTYPIIAIMSQSAHANQGDAEGLEFSDLVLTGFPVAEFRLLYKVVFKADSTHGHLTSVWDLRQLSATTPSAAIGSDHGLLSGLGDDDHPQYLLRTDAPTTVTVNGTSITLGSSGTVTAAAGTLTGDTLNSTVVTSSLTSLGSLTGLTVGGSGGDLTMTGGAITGVGNITATGILAVNASGGITTTQTSFDIVNSTATTVNIGGAATAVNIGATTGTLTLNNPTVVGTQTTQAVFDTVATTVTAFRAATTATIGATSGTLTLRNPTVVGTQTTVNLWNTTSTTVNAFGAATTLNIGATTGTTTVNNNLSMASGKTIGTTGTITSNHATAFIAGTAAESGVALQMPREGALRNLYNGANSMYFDVSIGGSTDGSFQFRSSNLFTNVLTMSPTGVTFNTDAPITGQTPYVGRTAWNSAIDTEVTIGYWRFRVSNQGGVFPQIIYNSLIGTLNTGWTCIAAISGTGVAQGGSTGTLIPCNSWTSLYTFHGMDSAADTIICTIQDKSSQRIYRVTFMRSDSGGTTGYNIIGERLL